METRQISDVSALPTGTFGEATPQWWGLVGMIAIEGTIFGLCIASYFYLRLQVESWPPAPIPRPELLAGTVNLAVIGFAAWQARILERHALRLEHAPALRHLLISMGLHVVVLALRIFEFRAFHVKWDIAAYGSIVFMTLFFHTLHVFTTLGENSVLAAYLARHGLDEKRALDLQLYRVYWDFIAASWVVLYAVLYFGPRVLN